MRTYELALVLVKEASLEELLTKVKAKIKDTKKLGLKFLAYPIKKQSKGFCVFLTIEMPETNGKDLEKLLSQSENVLRYLLVTPKKRG